MSSARVGRRGEQRGRGERFAEPRPENRAGDAEIGQASDRYRSQIGQISVTNRTDIGHKSDGYRSVGDGPGLSYSNIRRARCSLSKTATCRFPNPLGVASMLARGEARCSLAGEARCSLRAGLDARSVGQGRACCMPSARGRAGATGERVASGDGAIRPPDAMNNRTLPGKEEGLDLAAVVHGALGEEGSRTCRCGRRTRPAGRPGQE
jgi:hypothetical protein